MGALRVKDVDFGYSQITVRDGKGEKDRGTILPALLPANLLAHLERVKAVHQKDLEEGFGEVYLPFALARKYPRARWPSGSSPSSSLPPPRYEPARVADRVRCAHAEQGLFLVEGHVIVAHRFPRRHS